MQPKRKRAFARGLFGLSMSSAACWASLAFAKPPACPPGQRPGISGCRSGAPQLRMTDPSAPGAASSGASKPNAAQAPSPKARAPKTPPAPDQSLRTPNILERADRRLLMREIARLEELLKATPEKSPDRPMLLLRLAGAYSELRSLSERDYVRLEIQVEEMERKQKAAPPANRQLEHETTGPGRRLVL